MALSLMFLNALFVERAAVATLRVGQERLCGGGMVLMA